MTHTPTPMQVEEYQVPLGAGHYHVIGNATNELAYCSCHDDAAYIVRACNAHEELVAALRAILDGNTMEGKAGWTHADVIQAHYQIARKALASIEKGR